MHTTLPFDRDRLEAITERHPTPFHIYDEAAIRANARRLHAAFDWVPGGYMNYFAVKALPNPHIVRILVEEGMGVDCSSLAELVLAERCGVRGRDIMFTSNNTPLYEFQKAMELGAIVNLDDITHIGYLHYGHHLPEMLSVRYNPGSLKTGNAIIGIPEEAKYGFTRPQIMQGLQRARELGVERFALHTMVASNELDPNYFVETARLMFDLALEVRRRTGVVVEFINLGGGFGIPYRPEQKPLDYDLMSDGIRRAYEEVMVPAGLANVRIVTENGRVVTGPYGYLVTRVRHKKATYKRFLGLDATMADLMRPGMYGAYHHISVPGVGAQPALFDVTGSLCENNDKFAIDREIPEPDRGDYVVIHDTGAHGHSMGFNYNGKPRSAELLLRPDGAVRVIRRAETLDDLFTTIVWD